jgi:hypothetical protein
MAGTEANPVRLDPWQNIVEVGWNTITHVAFYVTGSADVTPGPGDSPPPDPGLGNRLELTAEEYDMWANDPDGGYSVSWDYASGDPQGESIFRRNGDWESADLEEWEQCALPAFGGGATAGPYQFTGSFDVFWDVPGGGGANDKNVPGQPGIPFDGSTSPMLVGESSHVFSGDPEWVETFDPLQHKYAAPFADGPADVFRATFSADGIVIIYKNKAYRAIATADHEPTPNNRRLWVLCERSPEDDPEPEE